jgi:hypothetical protein
MKKKLVHVFPKDDSREHSRNTEMPCWCKPILDRGVLIHKPKDKKLYP